MENYIRVTIKFGSREFWKKYGDNVMITSVDYVKNRFCVAIINNVQSVVEYLRAHLEIWG